MGATLRAPLRQKLSTVNILFRALLDKFTRCLIGSCRHRGDVFGTGRIIVTDKKNKPQVSINGFWDVRRCEKCGEPFAEPWDRVA